MSGHSKWATIKRKKALIDSKRSKAFAKYIKAIEVAARNGGPDPAANPTLYDAVTKAKKNSVPSDNIERALKRAAGEDGVSSNWETIMYEGYGEEGLEKALKEHVSKEIGPIARPKQIMVVNELPKTRSGKIMRRLLRDVAENRAVGDATTLADPNVMKLISEGLKSGKRED